MGDFTIGIKRVEVLADVQTTAAAFIEAGDYYAMAIQEWLATHGPKMHPINHFLRCNPVKLFWADGKIRYERTADFCLRGEVAHDPNQADKVLVHRAVEFTCVWKAR